MAQRALSASRRYVAVVFCDLVDSTRMLSMLGEVANDELRRDLFGALRCAIEAHGGTEVKNLGDGVMAAFPTVDAALVGGSAMLCAAARIDARWPSISVTMRLGCSAGEATEEDGDWFGIPVVEAARLCSAARAGEMYVAGHAARAARDAAGAVSVGALELKGLPAPVDTVAIRAAPPETPAWVLPPALDPALASPLVGRAPEVRVLLDAFAMLAGGGAVILVSGPPGAGKTRVVSEAVSRMAASGAVVVAGRLVDPIDPLQPLRDAGRWAIGGIPAGVLDDLPAETLDALAALLVSGEVWWPELGGRSGDGHDVVGATASLLAAMARDRPVVLVVDCGSGSPVLAAALHRLSEELVDSSVLLVVEVHEDDVLVQDTMRGCPRFGNLPIGVLDDDSLRTLAADLLGDDPGTVELIDALRAETGGLPARAIEIARAVSAVDLTLPPLTRLREAALRSCPYKGLLAYAAEDEDRFFGREMALAEILDRIEGVPVVALVGASGAGKSSLARAGAAPELRRRLDGPVAVMTPGAAPLASLDAVLAAGSPAALVVDQFEELFLLCEDASSREAFIVELLRLAATGTKLLLTIRGDAYGLLADHTALADLVERGTILLGAPDRDEMRRMIEEPARRAGCGLEPGLVELVLEEIGSDTGGLPLLSHVLLETWRRRRGTVLTIAAYRAAGGARGAIARTADTVHEALPGVAQNVARTLMLRLIELSDSAAESRRVMAVDDLLDLGGVATTDARVVLERLVGARLVTLGDDGSATISHEALIRNWPRLREWLETDRVTLQTERHLALAAGDWHRRGRLESDLYRGERLMTAEELVSRDAAQLGALQLAFLDASRQHADRTELRRRRTARRLRRLLVIAALATVAAVIAGMMAADNARTARAQAGEARRAAALATVQRLTSEARSLSATEPAIARNLAVEAYRRRPDLDETRSALFATLLDHPTLLAQLGTTTASAVAAGPDGLMAIATAGGVEVWDIVRPQRLHTLPVVDPDMLFDQIAFTPDGRLVVATNRGELTQWDAREGTLLHSPLELGQDWVILQVDNAGRRAMTSGNEGISVVDLDTNRFLVERSPLRSPGIRPYGAAALSGDGEVVIEVLTPAAGGDSFAVQRRSAEDLSVLGPPVPIDTTGYVYGTETDADGSHVLVKGGRTVLLDVDAGTSRVITERADLVIGFVEVGGDDLLMVGNEGGLEFLDPATLESRHHVDAQVRSATDVDVVDDRVVVGGASARVYDIAGSGPLWSKPVPMDPELAHVSPDGSLVVTRDPDPDVQVISTVRRRIDGTPVLRLEGEARFLDDDTLIVERRPFLRIVDLDGRDRRPPIDIGASVGWFRADPAGRRLAWSSIEDDLDGVHVLDLETGRELYTVALPKGGGANTSFTSEVSWFDRSGERLVAIANGHLVVVDARTGRPLVEREDAGYGAGFVRDDIVLVVGVEDVTLRDPSTLEALADPLPTSGFVFGASADRAGRFLAVLSAGQMRLVDLDVGRWVGPPVELAPGGSAEFTAGDELLVSTPAGLAVMTTDPEQWVDAACRSAGSNLSPEEWARYVPGERYSLTCPGLPVR